MARSAAISLDSASTLPIVLSLSPAQYTLGCERAFPARARGGQAFMGKLPRAWRFTALAAELVIDEGERVGQLFDLLFHDIRAAVASVALDA